MVLSKKSKQKLILLAPRKEKKVPACEMLEFSGSLSSSMLPILSWKLKIIAYRGSTTIFLHHLSWSCFANTKYLALSQRAASQMIWGSEIRL